MKTYKTQFLTILAALITAGITAQAQYTFTTLNDRRRRVMGRWITAISGTNIVGYYLDTNGAVVGACYNGSTWTTLDDPLADPSSAMGTEPTGISGTNIVGDYQDSDGVSHGFLYNGISQQPTGRRWTIHRPGLAQVKGRFRSTFQGQSSWGVTYASNGGTHGFLYNLVTSNWTTLDDPLGADGTFLGALMAPTLSEVSGMPVTSITGVYTTARRGRR